MPKPSKSPLADRIADDLRAKRIARKDACPPVKSIHPFPARMGMDIVWDELQTAEREHRP